MVVFFFSNFVGEEDPKIQGIKDSRIYVRKLSPPEIIGVKILNKE
jgi:hypothetical protein